VSHAPVPGVLPSKREGHHERVVRSLGDGSDSVSRGERAAPTFRATPGSTGDGARAPDRADRRDPLGAWRGGCASGAPSPLRWLARVDGDSAGSSRRGGRGGASDRQALSERDGGSGDRATTGGAERTTPGGRSTGAPLHPAARCLREEEDTMCFDPYVLERITASRLAELRADAARRL